MPLNFPDSPNNGDTYQGYTYNSTVGAWAPAAADTSGVTVYATVDDLPATGTAGDQAFVTASNRLYIWNGSGWYNIALINTTPTISGVSSSYTLASDGTATTVTITATDPEGLPITYSIASDTSGNTATVTQNANVFTITPSTNTADAGTFSLTFRASDGVNIATAVSEFTLAFTIQNSNYTTALITSVGANDAVNNTIIDSSTNSHTITAYGNATQTTFSPYRHGGYSAYFDGTGDRIEVANSTELQMGTGDFTFEWWWYPTAAALMRPICINGTGAGSWSIIMYANQTFDLAFATSAVFSSAVSYSINTWQHIAIVRENGTVTCYVDGVSQQSATNTTDLNATTVLGIGYDTAASSQAYQGYMTDVRIVKGTAVYTSAFTPPTERLTAITNTSLLTCHLPYFADGSTNNHTITRNGNTSIQPVSPYVHGGYDSAEHSGSIYLDGNGAYLATPSSAAFSVGTGDFTLELWTYYTASPSSYTFLFGLYDGTDELAIRTGDGGFGYRIQAVLGSGAAAVYNNTSYTTSYLLNKWTHLAFCRSGTTVTFYIDGIAVSTKTSAIDVGLDSDGARIGAGAPYTPNAYVSGIRFLNGTALYTSDFTPPTAPLTAITNTSLLLNGTNAGIIDKSQSNKLLTLTGDTKSSTTQTKYLTSSMYFDGAGDNILTDVMAASGDFTVETWIYFDGQIPNPANQSPTFFVWGTTTFMLYATSTTGILNMIGNGSGLISSSTAMTADTWHHVAFAREGNTGRLFLDGNLEGSTTSFSTSINARAVIGYPFKGYMSDVRVTHGLARYTSNFTPPTAALQG